VAQSEGEPRIRSLLMPHELLWPDVDNGPWLVSAAFGRVDGRAEVVGVTLESLGSPALVRRFGDAGSPEQVLPHALTTDVWRRLPIGRLMAQARASWKDGLGRSGLLLENPAAAEAWERPRRRGQVDLAQVAEVYLRAQRVGRPPTEAVRLAFGPMSKSAAAQRVSRARQQGLLAPTGRGRSSGEPAPSTRLPGVEDGNSTEAAPG
jgi:hypothetical protein